MTLLSVFSVTVMLFVVILPTLIVIRSLYQMFYEEEGAFFSFLYAATEPVLYPVRSALLRTKLFSSLPVDFSGIFTIIILMLVRSFLT